MILSGSRYRGLPVVGIKRGDQYVKYIEPRVSVSVQDIDVNYTIYTVVEGDSLDLICFKFGYPTRLWWLIADVNDLVDPFDLTIGQQIIVPAAIDFEKR